MIKYVIAFLVAGIVLIVCDLVNYIFLKSTMQIPDFIIGFLFGSTFISIIAYCKHQDFSKTKNF